jgi:hypothetical protein
LLRYAAALTGAVVATDSVSTDAHYENGGGGFSGLPVEGEDENMDLELML